MKLLVVFDMHFDRHTHHCNGQPGQPVRLAHQLGMTFEGVAGVRQQSKVVEVFPGQRGYYVA
jgi:hypothetical protein